MTLSRGSVVLVSLNPTRGHEQKGVRPCVVVSDPEVIMDQRFQLLAVIPVTGTAGEGILYPSLEPGKSGLKKRSFALVDQIRSVDKRRVMRVFGKIASSEQSAIDTGIRLFLGLESH